MNKTQALTIIDQLILAGTITYGMSTPEAVIIGHFGLARTSNKQLDAMRPLDAVKTVKEEDLKVVNLFNVIASVLLDKGMHLYTSKGQWVISLPSENAAAAERFLRQAQRRMSKATKLVRSTPAKHQPDDSTLARVAVASARANKQLLKAIH